jgi:hypothetical protein
MNFFKKSHHGRIKTKYTNAVIITNKKCGRRVYNICDRPKNCQFKKNKKQRKENVKIGVESPKVYIIIIIEAYISFSSLKMSLHNCPAFILRPFLFTAAQFFFFVRLHWGRKGGRSHTKWAPPKKRKILAQKRRKQKEKERQIRQREREKESTKWVCVGFVCLFIIFFFFSSRFLFFLNCLERSNTCTHTHTRTQ